MTYTVKQLADIAHISVRTLHFYDQMKLLKPAKVMSNGYRVYEEKELLRLQQILFFRELEFPLDEIKKILDAPSFNIVEALKDHKKLIELKAKRLNGLVETINKTIKKMTKNTSMKDEDLYGSFDKAEMEQYQKEAKERWGNTEAYKQSKERTKNWKKEDYDRIKKEQDDLMDKFVEAYDAGHSTTSPEVQALVALHRKGISQFYDVSDQMYKNLADMYIADERFTAFYEKYRKGMATFVHDAIVYSCQ